MFWIYQQRFQGYIRWALSYDRFSNWMLVSIACLDCLLSKGASMIESHFVSFWVLVNSKWVPGYNCTKDATLLPLLLLLEWLLHSKLASCAWLRTLLVIIALSATQNYFSNIFNLRWILCWLCSANNSWNSDVLRLSSEKYEVCEGGNWCVMGSDLEVLLEDELLEDFELLWSLTMMRFCFLLTDWCKGSLWYNCAAAEALWGACGKLSALAGSILVSITIQYNYTLVLL